MKAFTKLLLLALSLLLLASHPAQAVPILTLTTDSTSVEQGAEFSIALDVADIADLFGYNVTINYDPAKIRFVSVSEGGFLGSAGTSFFVPGVDDGAGSVAFSGAALIGAIGGANGGGNLLNFVFAGRGAGAALFTLSDLLFIDSTPGIDRGRRRLARRGRARHTVRGTGAGFAGADSGRCAGAGCAPSRRVAAPKMRN
ncbi:hypothetical protein G4G31_12310 [Massilia sp. Se16.2.3]|nr:cohesin domain-containing protein [Massilia sp. Se16.2.3]QNA99439.1 hypothetical protein G4G31_12310 [Massilia sp. Se16.2.3]